MTKEDFKKVLKAINSMCTEHLTCDNCPALIGIGHCALDEENVSDEVLEKIIDNIGYGLIDNMKIIETNI